jgi:DNA-binding PadR family transcriptional regulator
MNITTRDAVLPLTPQQLQILVALSLGRSTGYDVMRQVKIDTAGQMVLRPGGVYPSLKRLLELHHICECDQADSRPGQTSRVYELTGVGEQTLEWELERLEQAAQLGRERLSDARLRRGLH